MPTIRFLTPHDYEDMCAVVEKFTSSTGAWCNDPSVPARPDFPRLATEHLWTCFPEAMSNFWGYFDDAGKLVAWTGFRRWLDNKNITISHVIEDPDANLPRGDGWHWSEAAVDLVNWGIGYFWSEGVECFWCRLYAGREQLHISNIPNCLLSNCKREKVLDIPPGTIPPPEYQRVTWSRVGDNTAIYRFTDPLPLAAYLESANDPT
jgi:hypothetical protein